MNNKAQQPELFGAFVKATGVEVLGLIVWLALELTDKPVLQVIGFIVLFVALTAERVFVVTATRLSVPLFGLMASALIETVIWAVWLAISNSQGLALGGLFLVIGILVEHSIQLDFSGKQGLFSYIFNPTVMLFSAVEAGGSVLWLMAVQNGDTTIDAIVAVTIIGVTIVAEHTIQGIFTNGMPESTQTV